MPKTYEGVLQGDRIRWTADGPDLDRPARVRVTVVEVDEGGAGRGERMAAALEGLARLGGIAEIGDPVEWQRQQRADRPLPGREE